MQLSKALMWNSLMMAWICRNMQKCGLCKETRLWYILWSYVVGSKSFRPDQLFKVTEIKQLCYFSTQSPFISTHYSTDTLTSPEMALYIPHSIFHLARLLYVRPETFGPYYVCRWIGTNISEQPAASIFGSVQGKAHCSLTALKIEKRSCFRILLPTACAG